MARLLSVNVGLPRDIAWQGKTVSAPRSGRRRFRAGGWCGGRVAKLLSVRHGALNSVFASIIIVVALYMLARNLMLF